MPRSVSVPRLSDEKDPEPVGVDKLWDGRISRGLSGAPLRLGEDPGVELGPVDAAILVLATAPRKGRASALVIGQALDMGKATHAVVVVVVVVVRGELGPPLSKLSFLPVHSTDSRPERSHFVRVASSIRTAISALSYSFFKNHRFVRCHMNAGKATPSHISRIPDQFILAELWQNERESGCSNGGRRASALRVHAR